MEKKFGCLGHIGYSLLGIIRSHCKDPCLPTSRMGGKARFLLPLHMEKGLVVVFRSPKKGVSSYRLE